MRKNWERRIPKGKQIDPLIRQGEHKTVITLLNSVKSQLRTRAKDTVTLAKQSNGKNKIRLINAAKADVAKAREIDLFLYR
jgi:hypothetical protein